MDEPIQVARFDDGRVGIVVGGRIHDVTERIPAAVAEPALWVVQRSAGEVAALVRDVESLPLDSVSLRSPIVRPGKVLAAPVNYRAHVEEMLVSGQAHGHVLTDIRQAGLFLKASSSVVGPADGIAQRFLDRRTDHEIELCAIIGRRADRVHARDALAHVAGWCLGLDITVRGPEDRSFRKSIDSYCVLGPWLTAANGSVDSTAVELTLSVNGERRQHASTAGMVLGVAELIEFASGFYTLEPGDVLMTGTPQGVGPIRPGDELVVEGTGLGRFSTRVRSAA